MSTAAPLPPNEHNAVYQKIRDTETGEKTWLVSCPCEWEYEATSEKFAISIGQRHEIAVGKTKLD